MSRRIKQFVFFCLMLLSVHMTGASAEGIKIKSFELEKVEGDWLLNASFQIELAPGLEDAVQKGVVLYFQTEFELIRGRWYWFDEKVVDVQRTSKISYQALTDQYRVTLGSVTITAANLKQAMGAVSSIDDWAVIEQPMVSPNQTYVAAIRMKLDTNQLAKPFQVNAINSKAWNLQSEWSKFDFTPKMAASTHGAISQ